MEITADNVLITLAINYNGDWDKIYKDIAEKRTVHPDIVERTITHILPEIKAISLLNKEYPEELKKQQKPPFVIFEVEDDDGSTQYTKYSEAVNKVKGLKDKKDTVIKSKEIKTLRDLKEFINSIPEDCLDAKVIGHGDEAGGSINSAIVYKNISEDDIPYDGGGIIEDTVKPGDNCIVLEGEWF